MKRHSTPLLHWKNERGFMFPIAISLLLIFLTSTFIFIHQYYIEKEFIQQKANYEQDQFYLLQSLKRVEKFLHEGNYVSKGTFFYDYGNVTYSIDDRDENLLSIQFELLRENGVKINGVGFFDMEQMRTVKWIEGIPRD